MDDKTKKDLEKEEIDEGEKGGQATDGGSKGEMEEELEEDTGKKGGRATDEFGREWEE